MSVIILYVSTVLIFLALDAVMLTYVMRPLFEQHIGDLLLADIRVVPAALFYLAYVAGLVWLVSLARAVGGRAEGCADLRRGRRRDGLWHL